MKLYGFGIFVREFIGSYINIPKLAWLVLPLILLDTFIISICLNISQYLIKVFNLKELVIGEIISFYYAGSLIGALIGGSLTLKYSTAYISSLEGVRKG